VTIASLAIPAFTAAYADRYTAEEMGAILTPEGAKATPTMAAMCLLSENKEIHAIADPLIGNYVTSDPSTTEPWATLLKENSAGGSPIGVPIFVAQGLGDKLVIPKSTEGYVKSLCAAGENVTFEEYNDVTHALIADIATPKMLEFFAAANTGTATSRSCGNS